MDLVYREREGKARMGVECTCEGRKKGMGMDI